MVDTRIRKNERCVIGLPACDYVFSSTRSCFIAYGFATSALERDILKGILQERGIEPVEAGNLIDPGKFVFCTKICSKIIVSQFCIVLINKDAAGPNANVNMEYGLMLGHNKYVIPFQRSDEHLPFNVAGLDTVKYDQGSFRRLAVEAIDRAISETSQHMPVQTFSANVELFLLIKNSTVVNLQNDPGDRQIYDLGSSFGFNLIRRFDGLSYIFLGNFSTLQGRAVIWRVSKLFELIDARLGSVPIRVAIGLAADATIKALEILFQRLEIWLIVSSEMEQHEVNSWLSNSDRALRFPLEVFTIDQVNKTVSEIPGR